MNEQTLVNTLVNALRTSTVMSQGVLNNARIATPELFNRALAEYNNTQRASGRPISQYQPVAVKTPVAVAVAQAIPVNVNLDDEEITSLELEEDELQEFSDNGFDGDTSDLEELEVLTKSSEEEDDSNDSIEDDDDEGDVIPSLIDDTLKSQSSGEPDGFQFPEEPIVVQPALIETLAFVHTLDISIFLDDTAGEVYDNEGNWLTTKQPLRRGTGTDTDPIGAVRNCFDAFIKGVAQEGESIRFPVAVTSVDVEHYVNTVNADMQERLSESFSDVSQVALYVTSEFEQTQNAWGGDSLRAIRNISLSFPIPAIVGAAKKKRDEQKMLASNLKIINNLVARLRETATLADVRVNILIADTVVAPLNEIFSGLLAEGSVPVFDRGYARFTVVAVHDGEE